ncbi:hypothetical protein GCM10010873_36730 [Cypionkella aquatica]|uniref:Uncharacterized protein n=1 Tax=Cypionkella aquatica TaxID=1756042 RepID=A0AA37X3K4_9RHOB|nr:hypothetical protein GCM10010873_36730 [Cypionkella aquatica]
MQGHCFGLHINLQSIGAGCGAGFWAVQTATATLEATPVCWTIATGLGFGKRVVWQAGVLAKAAA